jgi:hypothetical protein
VIGTTPEITLQRCAERVAALRGLSNVRAVRRLLQPLFTRDAQGVDRPDSSKVELARSQAHDRRQRR